MKLFLNTILTLLSLHLLGQNITVVRSNNQTYYCPGDSVKLTVVNPELHPGLRWNVIEIIGGNPQAPYFVESGSVFCLTDFEADLYVVKAVDAANESSVSEIINAQRSDPSQDFEFYFPGAEIDDNGEKNITICQGDSIRLSYPEPATGSHIFRWNTGETTREIYAKENGQYILSVRIGTGSCPNHDTINIVNIDPQISFDSPSTNVCQGSNKVISVNGNRNDLTYNWSTGETNISEITVSDSGVVSAIGSIENTQNQVCADTAWIRVDLSPLPQYDPFDTLVIQTLPKEFNGEQYENSNYTYIWYSSSDEVVSEEAIVIIDTDDTLHTLKITDANTNCSVLNRLSIEYNPIEIPEILEIPNILAPSESNPDNASFRIYGEGISESNFSMEVYNRWGEVVFSTTDLNEAMSVGWIGSMQNSGSTLQSGTYTYKVTGEFLSGSPFDKIGSVTLMN